jgi:hypothetical protein
LDDPCPGFLREGWVRVYGAAMSFLDSHAQEAAAIGWTAPELFGVHPVVGLRRVDCAGALMVSGGNRVAEVSSQAICYANGLTYWRAPIATAVPVWSLRRAA